MGIVATILGDCLNCSSLVSHFEGEQKKEKKVAWLWSTNQENDGLISGSLESTRYQTQIAPKGIDLGVRLCVAPCTASSAVIV